jgi:S1-C subfamily serine protease
MQSQVARHIVRRWRAYIMILVLLAATPAQAQGNTVEEMAAAVVAVTARINPDGQTVKNLGQKREGSGVVIDASGLILTIGYLIVEAQTAEVKLNTGRTVPAEIVGYDHETGFGLLRAQESLKVRPLSLGASAEVKTGDRVVIVGAGGVDALGSATVSATREFAGNWEYLLDSAIFTTPPYPNWAGTALVNREGKLLGIGSLIVGDTTGKGDGVAGNMFVPIDGLRPILGDLLATGRISSSGKPWLGITADEVHGRLFVRRVTPGGPADKAGIKARDVVAGVNGEPTATLGAFYRKVWARGDAGVSVPIDIETDGTKRRVDVTSGNRLDFLKLGRTF